MKMPRIVIDTENGFKIFDTTLFKVMYANTKKLYIE